MARTTVDDCLTYVANRYELVLLASKRARQLALGGAITEIEDTGSNEKSTVLALREIGEGVIDSEQITKQEEQENPVQEVDFESILRGFEEADRELEAREEEKQEELNQGQDAENNKE